MPIFKSRRPASPSECCPYCASGKSKMDQKTDYEGGCPWWINSPEHGNDFWTWVEARSYADGRMEPLLHSEIRELLGCYPTKVHFLLKDALEKLRQSNHLHVLADFYRGTSNLDFINSPDVEALLSENSEEEDSEEDPSV